MMTAVGVTVSGGVYHSYVARPPFQYFSNDKYTDQPKIRSDGLTERKLFGGQC